MPESTRMIQDGSHPVEVMEVEEKEVMGWASSFDVAQWVGH